VRHVADQSSAHAVRCLQIAVRGTVRLLTRYSRWRSALTEQRRCLLVSIVIFLGFALDLGFRGSRYANTPSYANLLDIAGTNVWAITYAVVGLACLAAYRFRTNAIVVTAAHMLGMALSAGWLVAFIIRTSTDDGTTAANVFAWSVYFLLITRSAQLVDLDEQT
jgi:hypothetical protein